MIALRLIVAFVAVSAVARGATAPVPPCPECQWNLPKGWRFDGPLLRGLDASFEVAVVQGDDTQLVAAGVETEVARLGSELEARGLKPVEPIGRIVTTALGEPTIVIEFGLSPTEGQVLPASRGARLVRRCGATATFDLFADPAEPQKLSKASSVLSWARPECARFNRAPYVADAAVMPIDLDAVVVSPAQQQAPTPEGEGIPWTLLGAFGGLSLLAIGATVAYNRVTYRRLPPIHLRAVAEPVAVALAPERSRQERATTSDDVDDAAREVYQQAPTGGTNAELQSAMAELSRAVPLTRAGVPFHGATGVPDRYLEVLQLADGPAWGHGWLRLLGARPGAVPEVKELNRHLSRVLGGRFAIGYGGFGIVIAIESKGAVVACEPYFGSLVRIADGPAEMFEALAKDSRVRAQICDPERLRKALDQCGALGEGEVFDPGAQDAQKVSLLTLWANASSLPKG